MNPAHNTQFFDRSDATMDIDQDEITSPNSLSLSTLLSLRPYSPSSPLTSSESTTSPLTTPASSGPTAASSAWLTPHSSLSEIADPPGAVAPALGAPAPVDPVDSEALVTGDELQGGSHLPNSAVASEDEVAEILAEFDEANEDMRFIAVAGDAAAIMPGNGDLFLITRRIVWFIHETLAVFVAECLARPEAVELFGWNLLIRLQAVLIQSLDGFYRRPAQAPQHLILRDRSTIRLTVWMECPAIRDDQIGLQFSAKELCAFFFFIVLAVIVGSVIGVILGGFLFSLLTR